MVQGRVGNVGPVVELGAGSVDDGTGVVATTGGATSGGATTGGLTTTRGGGPGGVIGGSTGVTSGTGGTAGTMGTSASRIPTVNRTDDPFTTVTSDEGS